MGLVKLDSNIPIDAIVEVLLAHLRHEKTECRVATLNWIRHLHLMQPTQVVALYITYAFQNFFHLRRNFQQFDFVNSRCSVTWTAFFQFS